MRPAEFFRQVGGFSLVEILITLSLLALLLSLSISGYDFLHKKIKHTDGHNKQLEIMSQQQAYFARYQTYTLDLDALGFEAKKGSGVASDQKHFYISANRCDTRPLTQCVKLTATSSSSQHNDVFVLYSDGSKTP